MKSIKSLTVSIISSILLISCAFVCGAASMNDWEENQEKVFKMAKEQDKYIVLFVGRPTCPICKNTYANFTNPADPLKKILDDNYIIWYSYHDDPASYAEVLDYTQEILKVAKTLPLVFVINPDEPGKIIKSFWGTQTVEQVQKFLTIDLLSESKLTWQVDKEKAFKLAKEQDKYIVKLAGRGTSGNCHQLIKQLNTPSLKKMLDDNYILWYSDINSDDYVSSGEDAAKSLPMLYLINPDEPDVNVDRLWGNQSDQQLADFLTIDLLSGSSLTWYEDKDKVFSLATAENKYIFKLIGQGTSVTCHQVMRQLDEDPLKQLLEDHFVLWFSDDISEASLSTYAEASTLPYITILSPDEPDQMLDVIWGVHVAETLEEVLYAYAVSNEMITSDSKVFIWGNALHLSNGFNDEQIQIFTLTGQRIASVRKNDYTFTMDASYFPKGVLIVSGSTGWNAKLIVR